MVQSDNTLDSRCSSGCVAIRALTIVLERWMTVDETDVLKFPTFDLRQQALYKSIKEDSSRYYLPPTNQKRIKTGYGQYSHYYHDEPHTNSPWGWFNEVDLITNLNKFNNPQNKYYTTTVSLIGYIFDMLYLLTNMALLGDYYPINME